MSPSLPGFRLPRFLVVLFAVAGCFAEELPASGTEAGIDAQGFVSSAPPLERFNWPTPRGTASFRLVPGHVYATESFKQDILQIDSSGQVVATLAIPDHTSGFKGIAFGPNGRMFVVAVSDLGYRLLELDEHGSVVRSRPGPDYVFGNLSYGKVAVSRDGTAYVAGQNVLRKFSPGAASGQEIYGNNQVFDVAVLPNGNLMVASAYVVEEITSEGTFVRSIGQGLSLTDVRGLLYVPATDDVYLTMLGSSGNHFRIMRLDASSGILERSEYFWYGDDMTLSPEGTLIVGSRTQAPGRFSANLVQGTSLQTDERMFVAVMPEPILQFQDGFE